MNLIKADDQQFGNTFFTTINEDESHVGYRPHIAWGCSGMAKIDGEWHLFNEDDGHYWSIGIVTEEEIEAVKNGLIELRNNLEIKGYKCRFKRGIPKIKSDLFQFQYETSGRREITSFIIKIRDIVEQNHPCWIDSHIKCWSLKPNDVL